ncbi:GNAT family N-acetyltransferase [Clostridium botulinum]|uniref:GNAT family N-acetyltransferase n=1 Tax=unclassified Clostridium TaxID=2614128 RepID=UPI00069096BF|nr:MULTISPECIES: GNAT family N-acetyltransferase [unclassified Clostridium]MBY6780449.1 GNAT family N-acetyltransferase [Clostridium botulinum]MBY6853602.1 GNAT family N-acetyltransferase [Clostridium botulinum]MBY7009174.1 GNAT family N-acetyltransferase [Clostridium botulinum]
MDIIYTDRLVIREFTQVDIDKVFPFLSDPIVMKHYFGHLDIIGAQKWLNTTIESYKKYGYDFWAAYEKNADTFLGTIGLLNEEIDGKQYET